MRSQVLVESSQFTFSFPSETPTPLSTSGQRKPLPRGAGPNFVGFLVALLVQERRQESKTPPDTTFRRLLLGSLGTGPGREKLTPPLFYGRGILRSKKCAIFVTFIAQLFWWTATCFAQEAFPKVFEA